MVDVVIVGVVIVMRAVIVVGVVIMMGVVIVTRSDCENGGRGESNIDGDHGGSGVRVEM